MPNTADEFIKQQLLSRVRPNVPYRAHFHGAIENAFLVLAKFDSERERINADGRFSDQGKREAVATLVTEQLAPELARGAARTARHAAARNESRKTAIGRPSFDKTDAVGAMERREVRDYLRCQPEGKRLQVALEIVKDRPLAEAILSGPTMALTGLTADQFKQVHQFYLQTFFGQDLADVESERSDIETVSAAAAITWKKLVEASAMPVHDFNKLWTDLEVKADAA